jgi:hypothetical protein
MAKFVEKSFHLVEGEQSGFRFGRSGEIHHQRYMRTTIHSVFYRSQQGTRRKVLFEHTRHGRKMMGFTENYVKIVSDYDASLVNRVIEIEIGKLDEKHMAMEAIFLNHQKQKCK